MSCSGKGDFYVKVTGTFNRYYVFILSIFCIEFILNLRLDEYDVYVRTLYVLFNTYSLIEGEQEDN